MYPVLRRAAPALLVAVSAVALVSRFDPALSGSETDLSAVEGGATENPPVMEQLAPAEATEPATTASPTPSPASSARAEPAACEGQEVLGPVVSTSWGPTQVAAVVDAGVACSATAVCYPDGDSRSAMLSRRAIGIIDVEVAETGDASFDAVSGATVTSEGYRESLQAILDEA